MILKSCTFIIIPVHNRILFTDSCLKSLCNQSIQDFKIVVIDDGSTDGTEELIKNQYPEVILIKGNGNLWWTAATNMGVQYALGHGAKYILTLNNDTYAPTDFLEKMLYWAEQVPTALLGALAVDAETLQPVYGGERIRWNCGDSIMLLDHISPDDLHGLHEVTHFPGRGLLIPSKVFRTIGLYDQKNFPHYAADDDFTHRASRAGYPIFCNYDAHLFIYPTASGSVDLVIKKNLNNYYQHLFGIKGAANLKYFTRYCLLNCPRRYLPWFLLRGYFQRIFGYWFHWLIKSL